MRSKIFLILWCGRSPFLAAGYEVQFSGAHQRRHPSSEAGPLTQYKAGGASIRSTSKSKR
jgi:hypothetical protein